MKYCILSNHPVSVLKEADEIYFKYTSKDIIFDYIDVLKDKNIILELPYGGEIEEKNWKLYQERFADFQIALNDLAQYQELNDKGIKWYWAFVATTYTEVRKLLTLGASQILIGPPLTFDLGNLKKIVQDVNLRTVSDLANLPYFPDTGDMNLTGFWIRPEDISKYEPYISTIQFSAIEKEESLLKIYKKNQEWPGNLNLLISGLNYSVDNKFISDTFTDRRINCGQRCKNGRSCGHCLMEAVAANTFSNLKRQFGEK